MKPIDLKKIIEENGLSESELANQLFPGNKFSKKALTRVIKGQSELSATQISKLAFLLGTDINSLFDSNSWKTKSDKDLITFEKDGYRAELNTRTWTTKVYENDSLFHEEILQKSSIKLSEYLHFLNNLIINKNESNGN